MKTVALPSGQTVPALGQGTWNIGDRAASRTQEIAALRTGLDLGLTLIDTAEMYGDGRSEELVAAALAGRRDEAFIVSKVYPHNASRTGAVAACERSLKRLQTDRIDLYLLHWRGSVPFAETIGAFEALQKAGKIRYFGVSNLDLADVREWVKVNGGAAVAVNQVLYNLTRRGSEWELLPWLRERRIPIMAYSPMEQARLLRDPRLTGFAQRHGMTAAQAALAWLLANEDVIVIPKASHPDRVKENAAACNITLTATQRIELDHQFAAPVGPTPLEML